MRLYARHGTAAGGLCGARLHVIGSCRSFSRAEMLPITRPDRGGGYKSTPPYAEYAARMMRYRQMDFEYATWFMANLCISPRTAFRST